MLTQRFILYIYDRSWNLSCWIKCIYVLALIAFLLSIGIKTFAQERSEIVSDISSVLNDLKQGECAVFSESHREGFYMITFGIGCDITVFPIQLKECEAGKYIKACLEDCEFVSVMRSEMNGYFHVFDPQQNYLDNLKYNSGFIGSYYYGLFGEGIGGALYSAFSGLTPGNPYYQYGLGMNPTNYQGNMPYTYMAFPVMPLGLYGNTGIYGGLLGQPAGYAHSFYTLPALGLSGLLRLNPYSSLQLNGDMTFNNNLPNVIPSENNMLNGEISPRYAHDSSIINPAYLKNSFSAFAMRPFGYGTIFNLFNQ